MDTRTKYEKAKADRGFTDYKVAKESGVPASTLYDWVGRMNEKPYSTMSVGNMCRVAQALGITLGDLIGDVH